MIKYQIELVKRVRRWQRGNSLAAALDVLDIGVDGVNVGDFRSSRSKPKQKLFIGGRRWKMHTPPPTQ